MTFRKILILQKMNTTTVGSYSVPTDVAASAEGRRIAGMNHYLQLMTELLQLRNRVNEVVSLMSFAKTKVIANEKLCSEMEIQAFGCLAEVFVARTTTPGSETGLVETVPFPPTYNLSTSVTPAPPVPRPLEVQRPLEGVSADFRPQIVILDTDLENKKKEAQEKKKNLAEAQRVKDPLRQQQKLKVSPLPSTHRNSPGFLVILPDKSQHVLLESVKKGEIPATIPTKYMAGIFQKIEALRKAPPKRAPTPTPTQAQPKSKKKKSSTRMEVDPPQSQSTLTPPLDQISLNDRPTEPESSTHSERLPSNLVPVIDGQDPSEVWADTHKKK